MQPAYSIPVGGMSNHVNPYQMGAYYAQSPLQSCANPQSQSYGAPNPKQSHMHNYGASGAMSPHAHAYANAQPPSAPSCPPSATDPQFVQKVAQAIDGEYTAICCYAQLMNQAPTDHERQVINEIRQDEIRHFQTFQKIYASMTSQTYQPQMKETCPPTYTEGLMAAFHDEQKTVDQYLEIAYQTQDPLIKDSFLRAAADEQNHAVWFQHLIVKNCYTPMPCCS